MSFICEVPGTANSSTFDKSTLDNQPTHSRHDRRESELAGLWQLLEASGYLALAGKSPAAFAELERRFFELGRRADELSSIMGQFVFSSPRGVEATLSCLKSHRHTWLLHQLARRRDQPIGATASGGQMLRDIYGQALAHPPRDPELRWLLSYIETDNPWVERVHLRFAQRHAHAPDVLARPFRMVEVSCLGARIPRARLELGAARPEELALLAEQVARTQPACYAEALDLVLPRLTMQSATTQWRAHGLERRRQVLVARTHGRAIAAAVLELGQLGSNLFRLLDSVRLFPLAPDGRDVYGELLDAARLWFAAAGRSHFMFLCEDPSWEPSPSSRLQAMATPWLWLLPARLIPEFLDHVTQMSAGQPARDRSQP